jgi:hypothetical protein
VVQGRYGDELDKLVPRAKVHLNMHHAEEQPLESARINYLMANHGTVVSEYGSDHGLNEKYKDGVLFTEYDGLIEACVSAIDNPLDGYDVIRKMPQDCTAANDWLTGRAGMVPRKELSCQQSM